MFGYIITNGDNLPKERSERFREFYCGLCRTLRRKHGVMGGLTLSYDMTFLAVLLNALYEPEERRGEERCPVHPLKRHHYVDSPVLEYCADMNIALAYHKCLDNWLDDRSVPSAVAIFSAAITSKVPPHTGKPVAASVICTRTMLRDG